MKRRLALLAATGAVLLPPATAAAPGPPVVRLVDRTPATVVGQRFRAHERVAVRIKVGDAKRVRTVTTTRAGSFRVVFAGLNVGSCGYTVSAVTARRSTQTVAPRACTGSIGPPPIEP